MAKNKISIIIPYKENIEFLEITLKNLITGEMLPDEIIIIDTSGIQKNDYLKKICDKYAIIKIIKKNGAYPGLARNIGIENSFNDLIGFLDTRTVPSLQWLSSSYKLLIADENISGVYGRTEYYSTNEKSKLIKFSTYGMLPLITVPGMLIKRNAIIKIGNFIPTTRAGEDADWMMRLHLQKIKMIEPIYPVTYYGLDEIEYVDLFLKWIRNYMHSSNLPYLHAHKSIYYHGVVIIILIGAFNWNWLMAGWNMESDLYIPHITKLIGLILVSTYSIIRGVILPYKKGVNLTSLMPFRWLHITLISSALDFAKMLGFLISTVNRKHIK